LLPRDVARCDIDDAEEFAAQGEERAVLIGIFEAEAELRERLIGMDPGHRAGEAGVAEFTDRGLRDAAGEIAEEGTEGRRRLGFLGR
jgi:hypothetical protein